MNEGLICPHCEHFFQGQLFMKIAPIQVVVGKPFFCPKCGRKMSVEAWKNGNYDVGRAVAHGMNKQYGKVGPSGLAQCPTDEIVDRVSEVIADNYNVSLSSIQPETKLGELDVYDYDLVSLIIRLEFDFGIKFLDEEIDLGKAQELTVQYISDCVQKHMSQRPAGRRSITGEPDRSPRTSGTAAHSPVYPPKPEKKWWQFWK